VKSHHLPQGFVTARQILSLRLSIYYTVSQNFPLHIVAGLFEKKVDDSKQILYEKFPLPLKEIHRKNVNGDLTIRGL
jgi:hypothetical protein